MNEQEQRIAVAEFCGWRWVPDATVIHPHPLRWWVEPWYKDDAHNKYEGTSTSTIPDYTNDLNAIREAELILDENQKIIYTNFLGVLLVRPLHPMFGDMTNVIHNNLCFANAQQKAEALLKTIGKWTE